MAQAAVAGCSYNSIRVRALYFSEDEKNMSYRQLVEVLPHPSEDQIVSFWVWLCNAHSWYKHLPSLPPGKPFCVYLDPAAGMAVREERGSVTLLPKPAGAKFFHYNEMPTELYRSRFGYLNFSSNAGTRVGLVNAQGVTWPDTSPGFDAGLPIVYDASGSRVQVPADVASAGRFFLTKAIHKGCDAPYNWFLGHQAVEPGFTEAFVANWVAGGGDPSAAAPLAARLVEDEGSPFDVDFNSSAFFTVNPLRDPPAVPEEDFLTQKMEAVRNHPRFLGNILANERARQRDAFVVAVHRMLATLAD